MPGLYTLKIVRQLDHAAHEHRVALIALGDGIGKQGIGKAFHFLDQHGCAVQLNHAQGALRLVQVGCTKAHEAGVGWLVDIGLKGLTSLLESLVEFALDPAQRGEIIVQFHFFLSSWRNLPTISQTCRIACRPHSAQMIDTSAASSSRAVNWLPPGRPNSLAWPNPVTGLARQLPIAGCGGGFSLGLGIVATNRVFSPAA